MESHPGRGCWAHCHCAEVFSKPITAQGTGSTPGPPLDCLHQQAGWGFPGHPSFLGTRGQSTVEASGEKRGFLWKRTSFTSPSVSSHSTICGQTGSYNILENDLALSSCKVEHVRRKGLICITSLSVDRAGGALLSRLYIRMCYK